jgi:DNA-binding NtrC family response regulator
MTTLTDILIVEDEESVVNLYKALFSAFTEYSFVAVSTGEEVEDVLLTHVFKVGIIDIRLAGPVNGVDVAVLLHSKCPDMVLFAMTGLACIFDDHDPSVAGFTACFAKPTEFMDLLEAVKQTLKNYD